MHEAKIVIGIASLCSLAAILATLVVIPQLYTQINEVNARVMDGVQVWLWLVPSPLLLVHCQSTTIRRSV